MGVEVPKRKSLIAPLVITAAALGIVQGFFWFLLSLVAILFYENKISPIGIDYNEADVGRIIYDRYLNNEINVAETSYIIGPKEFNYFMYFYLVFSFSLLVISSVLLWASITEQLAQYYKRGISSWIVNMTIVSLLDFILMCLIAHDYHKLQQRLADVIMAEATVLLVSIGIVMTLAARGFVVWIINVIFIIILGKHLANLKKKETQPDPSILDAYTTGSRPPWETSNSLYDDANRSGYNNKGYRDDNDNPMITSSSQSFTHLPLHDRDNYASRDRGNQKNQNPYMSPYGGQNNNGNNKRRPNDNGPYGMGANNSPLRPMPHAKSTPDLYNNQWEQPAPLRTAKIGRQGGQRSPPLNVNSPYIPDPDYSPPGSPRVRGVLRPKSNYAMY